MRVVKRKDGWWVSDLPCEDCGPYKRRASAEQAGRGLLRFFKYEDRPGFVTTDRRNAAQGVST